MRLLLVVVGGALGSGARYLVSAALAEQFGWAFPWGTLAVNVLGSWLIGLIATLADEADRIGPNGRLFLVAGVLGGFTTFSAFSLETLRLWEEYSAVRALLNVAVSLILCLGAVLLGIAAGRAFVR